MFNRWHPQIALRYLPIARFIKSLKIKNLKILEVGSGSLGIGPYLNQEITGVDVDFSGPSWPKLKKVFASADKLPFDDNSFDVTLSVDVIEHLPNKIRQKSIDELFRVASLAIVIAFPTGKLAVAQDLKLDKLYRHKFGKPFEFLSEHLKYKLPRENQIISWVNQAANKQNKPVKITKQGNRNLNLRLWLMKGWMSKNILTSLFFRKVLLLFLPLLKLIDNKPPHYRQIFFVRMT